jgi:hypothetical protein
MSLMAKSSKGTIGQSSRYWFLFSSYPFWHCWSTYYILYSFIFYSPPLLMTPTCCIFWGWIKKKYM